ncbi:hypothetical protein T439DRAFT_353531 [Meredithblackwellia eburnea MCA 4105]
MRLSSNHLLLTIGIPAATAFLSPVAADSSASQVVIGHPPNSPSSPVSPRHSFVHPADQREGFFVTASPSAASAQSNGHETEQHHARQARFAYNPLAFGTTIESRRRLVAAYSTPPYSSSLIPPQLLQPPPPPPSSHPHVQTAPGTVVVTNSDTGIIFRPEKAWELVRGVEFVSGKIRRAGAAPPSRIGSAASSKLEDSEEGGEGKEQETKEDEEVKTDFAPSFSFTFTGTGIDWYGSRSPYHGRARVTIDGKEVATVDAYSPRWLDGQLLFSSRGLVDSSTSAHSDKRDRETGRRSTDSGNLTAAADGLEGHEHEEHHQLGVGMHEIMVELTGSGQRRSKGVQVDLDAFVVWEGKVSPLLGRKGMLAERRRKSKSLRGRRI